MSELILWASKITRDLFGIKSSTSQGWVCLLTFLWQAAKLLNPWIVCWSLQATVLSFLFISLLDHKMLK